MAVSLHAKHIKIPQVSGKLSDVLQAKPNRALIILYDLEDTKVLLSVVVDIKTIENCIPMNESSPCIWRSLEWGELRKPLDCNFCCYDKDSGWFFRQKHDVHFICAGCLQGN